MAISYAGYPLLIPTPEQTAFIERYLSTADTRAFCPPFCNVSHRWESNACSGDKIGIPRPNYPDPPQTRVNTLYWPTGATRWAWGFFLADQATVKRITDDANADTTEGQTLLLTDESRTPTVEISAKMHLLTPRRLTRIQGNETDGLWLLPLVDVRYWWQYLDIGDATSEEDLATWDAFLTRLALALQITLQSGTVPSTYLLPDKTEIRSRESANAAVLMDAACHSVGRRFVRYPDGTCRAEAFTDTNGGTVNAGSAIETFLRSSAPYTPWDSIAGEASTIDNLAVWQDAGMADQVRVVFRGAVGGVLTCSNPDLATSEIANVTTGAARPRTVGYYTVFSTAVALLTEYGTTPTNETELQDLAQQVTDDYVASFAERYDYTFAGLKRWDSCAYDNLVEWRVGTLVDDMPCVYTRVQSMPPNFGVDEMLHQTDVDITCGDIQMFKLTEDLVAGGEADAKLWIAGAETDHVAVITDWASWPIATGKKIKAHWDCASQKWHPLAAERTAVDLVNTVCCVDGAIEGNTVSVSLDSKVDLGTDPCGGETGLAGPAESTSSSSTALAGSGDATPPVDDGSGGMGAGDILA